MSKLLALDLASFTSGVAIFDIETEELEDYFIIEQPKSEKNVITRIENIVRELAIKTRDYDIEWMGFESAFGKSSDVLRKLSWLQGVTLSIAFKRKYGIVTLDPNQWRSTLDFKKKSKHNPYSGTNREYQKNQAIELANRTYNLGLRSYTTNCKHHDDDLADAICIGLALLKEMKRN